VRAAVFGTAAFSLGFLLLAGSIGHTQSPPAAAPAPLPGFVPAYEITKIVRASGFDPLAPPRREGTTYVLRATDFRGILFRIVVDARSGAIRAANRIVPGPGPYGSSGIMAAGPYGEPPPYGVPPPYGMIAPPPYGPAGVPGPEMGPDEAEFGPPMGPPGPPPPGVRSSMYPPAAGPLGPSGSSGSSGSSGAGSNSSAPPEPGSPPLPRPRPAGLAAREAQPAAKPPETSTAKPDAAPAASSAPVAAPPPAAVAPAPAAPKKLLQSAPIPD
jgi:hypothetical protein